jgi:transposase-like protein
MFVAGVEMNKQLTQEEMLAKAMDLIVESGADLKTLFDQDGLLKKLTKSLVERALQAEMTNLLGYEKYERSTASNGRNGSSKKELLTDNGVVDLSIPRDRDGKFEPLLLPKGQTRIPGLNEKIISLYAKGMSVNDIKTQLSELYGGAEISTALISKITDEVMDEVEIWRKRALESVYPIVFFDCLVVKVKQDKHIINKAVYVALGIDTEGKKDVLGIWLSENEGAKFWLSNLTELKNRGVQDMLIACTDNLTGMTEAISAVYPKTEHQLCIVHQIRNSLKFVSYKDRKALVADLKPIYKASTEEVALEALEDFAKKWDSQYPYITKSWYNNWDNLAIFFQYPAEIRRVIYTTNAIESLNSQLRKVTKNKRSFPSDDAVFKTLYLAIEYITKKWTMPIQNWNQAMAYFLIKFEGRI